MSLLVALLVLSAAPGVPLEPEIDSQTREDDELPPSSYIPYTPRFGGRKVTPVNCLQGEASSKVRPWLDQAHKLTEGKDAKGLNEAIALLNKVLATDPRTGWAYLTLGSAYAKLGRGADGARAYETYLLSCRRSPNTDRVQRILTDYWLKTSGSPR